MINEKNSFEKVKKELLDPLNLHYTDFQDTICILFVPPELIEKITNYCKQNGLVFCMRRETYVDNFDDFFNYNLNPIYKYEGPEFWIEKDTNQ